MSAEKLSADPGGQIDALRQQLHALQARHDRGELDADALAQARQPLERLLVDAVLKPTANPPAADPPAADLPAAPVAPPAPAEPQPSRRLQAGLALAVLALALLGYAFTGSPGQAGWGPASADATNAANGANAGNAGNAGQAGDTASAADGSAQPTPAQVAEMVDRLARRLKDRPDDAAGWALLARAYSAMGRYAEAVPAYDKVLALKGETADLLADSADALAGLNQGKLNPQALARIERALVLDPDNLKALALAGSAAFDARDFATAVRQWQRVESALPANSAFRSQIQASLAEARQLGGLPAAAPGAAVAGLPASAATGAVTSAATGAVTGAATGAAAAASHRVGAASPGDAAVLARSAVSGRVTLDPALAARAGANDTVFVFARAASGPRMPLAVLRKQVKDLPFDFTLDDSMAMAPTAKISSQSQVVVSARISPSGDALPQAGDLAGQAAAVAPGTRSIALRIAEVLGPPTRP